MCSIGAGQMRQPHDGTGNVREALAHPWGRLGLPTPPTVIEVVAQDQARRLIVAGVDSSYPLPSVLAPMDSHRPHPRPRGLQQLAISFGLIPSARSART